jgi:putative sterol carrier protein
MAYTNVKETFDQLYKNFNPQAANGVDAVFQWEILGDGGGSWHMTVKDQTCQLAEGKHPKPNVSQTSSVQTFLALVNNELGGMQAFMSGKLKVRGNILLAQKIMDIWPA